MILWTALSLALGLEIHGEIVRGMPCIKRFHQLFCPVAGNNYPLERIERFIDDNKSLMRRMYGEFQTVSEYGTPSHEFFENGAAAATLGVGGGGTKRRSVAKRAANGTAALPLPLTPPTQSGTGTHPPNVRLKRQSFQNNQTSETGRMDACESKVEVLTPYWATNSAGKVRAIVNTQHFEQAIHQEMCAKAQTKRCMGDCGCEQKYKWHRLLAYDPDNDCKGIFMDWFLFPACCVCRCAPMLNGQ